MYKDMSTEQIEISIEQLLQLRSQGHATLIDVRSPSEYEDSTIPGSINIPIFDDEERKTIGTLYKQNSRHVAIDRGLEIWAAKLPEQYKQYESLPGEKIVFCWRGGMRSKATATMLSLMGVSSYRLRGGYRAYRQWVVEKLENYELKQPVIVINGYTGSGKTRILEALSAQGYPVIDLEQMAQHRGSTFGNIGLQPRNQKSFESELVETLQRLKDAPYFIMEAESKRIGKVTAPDFLMTAKEEGRVLFIDMPLDQRVRNIIADYEPERYQEEFVTAFQRIKKKLHTPVAAQVDSALRDGRFTEAFALLLEFYYDPRYKDGRDKYSHAPVICKVLHIEEAVHAVKEQLRVWNL